MELGRLEPTDGERLRRFFYRLSPESRYRRFLSPVARPDQAQPERLLDIDHRDREAVVAVVGGEIIGVARYARLAGDSSAEMAVAVADEWQGRGVGACLARELVARATANGIRCLKVVMLRENVPAIALFRGLAPGARLLADGYLLTGELEVVA